MNAGEPAVLGNDRDAAAPDPIVVRLLQRMVQTSEDNADQLISAIQRVARELSSLSFGFNSHLIRAGIRSVDLQALDAQLDEASAVLSRTVFNLQHRLLHDGQILRPLVRIFEVTDLEDSRPAIVRLREKIDAYCDTLEREYEGIRETLAGLCYRLALTGNNIEITACRACAGDVSAPVDIFCVMASQIRTLADRLRNATADLRVFQQSQNGYAESLRAALLHGSQGAAA
jgi:hypothetical protein